MGMLKNFLVTTSAAVVFFAVPVSASAQESDQEIEANTVERRLEAVTVTSRFREESTQDIGGSISALSGDDLAAQGIDDVSKLALYTPALDIQDRGPGRNEISIRGIGRSVFQQDLSVSPANIGLYLDDVPINVLQGAQLDVRSFDLNRVEVLRGPQGTLFGEGAQGGAIRYFTKDPVLDEFSGNLEVYAKSVSDGGTDAGARAALNLPIIEDKVGLRVSYNRIADPGYIDNDVDGTEDTNDYSADNYRAVLLAEPTDKLRIRLFGQYEEADQGAFATANGDPDDLTLLGTSTAGSFVKDESTILSANVSYDFGPVKVESITSSFERTRDRRVVDAFFTNQALLFRQLFAAIDPVNFGSLAVTQGPVNPAYSIDSSTYDQLSQEFRFISQFDGPFNFVAGAFYRDFEFGIEATTESQDVVDMLPIILGNIALDQAFNPNSAFIGFVPTIPANPSTVEAVLGQQLGFTNFFGAPDTNQISNDGEQISFFVEGTYDLTEQLSVIAGARYHKEDIQTQSIAAAFQGFTGLTGASPPLNFPDTGTQGLGVASVERVLPKVSIEYTPSDSLLLYGLYAEGLRNGNINSGGTATVIAQSFGIDIANEVSVFDEELVRSLEGGIKYQSPSGDLTLNGAIYYNFFEDVQAFITFAGPPAFGIIDNVGDGHASGFEIEARYNINNNVTAFFGGNYIESQIDDLNDLASGGVTFLSGIVEGQPVPFIPEYSATFGLEGRHELGNSGWELNSRAVYSHKGEYTVFVDGLPGSASNPILGDYGVFDVSVGVGNERHSLDLMVTNLFDERQFNQASPTTEILESVVGGRFVPGDLPRYFMDDFQSQRPRSLTLTLRTKF